ncbi:hypothetical protein Tco_0878629 [Tanacetum coccineum]|uniref:Uncharacterized protein n=1 Tax=Tanacetum coccineum TaxID=301880 RepID=A0ABQ5C1U2_9ASTR
MSPSMEARIAEYAVAPTPPSLPPSLLSPWSSPLPQIPSPPLPVSSPPLPLPSPLTTSLTDAGAPLGYRAAGIQMRAASPPLLLPYTSHRTNILEVEMSPRKKACFTTLASGLEIGESSTAGAARQPGPTLGVDLRRDRVMETGYGITNTWDEIVEAMIKVASYSELSTLFQRVKHSELQVFEDSFLATCEQELCQFNFLSASYLLSSNELPPASY